MGAQTQRSSSNTRGKLMPYIKQESRMKFLDIIDQIPNIDHAGELNYLLTKIAMEYTRQKGLCYQTINDISGAFHNAYLEYYDRIVRKYEDSKIEENGDAY